MAYGRIIKGVGGLYTVFTDDNRIYECRAKGIFRKRNIKPLVGDNVAIEIINEKDKEGSITDIYPRKNKLIRPELANIDNALIVCALKSPDPNFLTVDKLILHFKQQNVPVIICFNKSDIAGEDFIKEAKDIYAKSGIITVVTSAKEKTGIDELKALLKGKLSGIAGVSGAGKSSLINSLQDNVSMEVGSISEKLKRGRHTTRHSEIIPVDNDTFIVDTPGFSSLDVFNLDENMLADYYEEFSNYNKCYYKPCSHTHEPDCEVKAAVKESLINNTRYNNYVHIYGELKSRPHYISLY